ncbi:prevent-host-death protein [Falsiroseomonas bella]|uniref:Antitoxin n=1 Tax=Falsiroseomonas bella TaxID=2184016 RepID=A0A317FIW9_9PROT|nr:type II toxin-antitoxin system Phd/YefM family antitoxin [Falsiroseomonas bella]PWS38950.1 prevent-host-death protein [Falsiroseomonas bella]
MRSMPLEEAEAALGDVLDHAARGDATVLTRRGQPVAVVVGFDEWQRLTAARRPLAHLLLSFPEGAELRRDRAPPSDLGV